MAERRYRFSPSRIVDTADRFVSSAEARGVIMNRAGEYEGNGMEIDGRRLTSFGSCSYLALELHPQLKLGCRSALERYGTQMSYSRAYLESPLYEELEAALSLMTGRHACVGASTTLAHFAALPVLVRDKDAVVIDQFAHASLHSATAILHDTHVEMLRHQRFDQLEGRLKALLETHRRVWYVCDGVYSMRGDFARFRELRALLERNPALHVYVDDAHATSWCGLHGRGGALAELGDCERVIVALSLNKAFAAAGGALLLPDRTLLRRIRRCGGPMLFSGPIQPPMLGAAVASARLHLDPSFPSLQAELAGLIEHAKSALARTGVPLASTDATPIFMVPCDAPDIAFAVVERLRMLGFYACPSVFPAVPMNQPGVRFTITRHNSRRDVDAFVQALATSFYDANAGALGPTYRSSRARTPP